MKQKIHRCHVVVLSFNHWTAIPSFLDFTSMQQTVRDHLMTLMIVISVPRQGNSVALFLYKN